jgi:hypothetical protein
MKEGICPMERSVGGRKGYKNMGNKTKIMTSKSRKLKVKYRSETNSGPARGRK